MIRFLLWALLFFIAYRIIKAITSSGGGWSRGERPSSTSSSQEFKSIEDAKFEDLPGDGDAKK